MYAKIENGRLKLPPSMLENVPRPLPPEEEGGDPVIGYFLVGYDPQKKPKPYVVEYLLGLGYLPVTETEKPEDGEGHHFEPTYTEGNGEIIQAWVRVENPDPEDRIVTPEEFIDIVFRGVR